MKIFRRIAVIGMVSLMGLVAGSPAQAGGTDSRIDGATKRAAGFTVGQLIGEEYRQLLELPIADNPLAGNGNNCLSAGRKHKVLILFTVPDSKPPAVCTIKAGTPVFFSSVGGECSSVEAAPFFGKNAREQRRCIVDFVRSASVEAILVSIDGKAPVNIRSERFLAVSRQRTVQLPDPNILGVADRQATIVAAAYSVLLRRLSPGTHTINVTVVSSDTSLAGTNRAIVTVQSGHRN